MISEDTDDRPPSPHAGMTFRQFVGFIAAVMALNAVAIDSMLPALPDIGRDLGIANANETQWVVTAYLLGFGGAQIIYGTLSDRFGRKPVLIVGIAIYVVAAAAAAIAPNFETMLLARLVMGIGAAASRVLAITIVRDCYTGATMARVMSLAFIVFLIAPIIAPSLGQIIMLFASWHAIFLALALYSAITLVWAVLKLPETMHPEDRIPISLRGIGHGFYVTLTTRVSVGYNLAITLLMGALFAFINSAQQVFADALGYPGLFTTVFALIAAFMALSSLLNSRIVERVGTRTVSHGAVLGFATIAAVHMMVAVMDLETIWTFSIFQAGMMFCFGLCVSNFNAMAMQPLGHVAGTASAVQGFVSTLGGAILGFAVGQQFDGTTVPLTIGFAVFSLMSVGFVLFAEGGRLFSAPMSEQPA